MKKEGTTSVCAFCGAHYYRPPSNRGRFCSRECGYASKQKTSVIDRVFSRVDKPDGEDGCWNWTGAIVYGGYGSVRDTFKRKTVRVHRVVYEHMIGPIPPGMQALHKCDNPKCCNPKHLFLGDHKANSDDKIEKGRDKNRGEQHHNCKLSSSDVQQIRWLLDSGATGRQVAEKFGVSEGTISVIKNNLRRLHG